MTLQEEFRILVARRESLNNQIRNTFNLKKKGILELQVQKIDFRIDKILDDYNSIAVEEGLI